MEGALNNSVLERVLVAIEGITPRSGTRIGLTTRLKEDLDLGRFRLLRLALHLEEMFDAELSDDTLNRCTTVGDIVRYLSRHYFRDADFPALGMAA